jgi:Arc/MetJ-type ribon-helix-helix transcriptional regulator
MTITLPPAFERLVKEKVGSGLYANEAEVVCDALRHEFVQDEVYDWVRAQAAAGFEQFATGDFESLTREELLSRLAQRREG